MMLIFYGVAFLNIYYFFLRKRSFDFISLASLSALFYFLPGFFGVASTPLREVNTRLACQSDLKGLGRFVMNNETLIKSNVFCQNMSTLVYKHDVLVSPLSTTTYLIMIVYLCFILLTGVLSKALVKNHYSEIKTSSLDGQNTNQALLVCVIVNVIFLSYMFIHAGHHLFSYSKLEIMHAISGPGFVGLLITTLFGFLLSYFLRNKLGILYFIGVSLFFLWLCYRYPITLLFLSFIIARLFDTNIPLKSKLCMFFCAALFCFILFTFAFLYELFKRGEYSQLIIAMFDASVYQPYFSRFETFMIQGNLNLIVNSNFTILPSRVFHSFYAVLPFSETLFNIKQISFNEEFQPFFYPFYRYGVGANIFAQLWSAWKFYGVIVGSVSLMVIALLLNHFYRNSGHYGRVLIISVSVYLLFFIHRNDLLFTLGTLKLLFLAWVSIYAITWVYTHFKMKLKSNVIAQTGA